jgi:endonuclease/exonuclease/phosphatase family metal-dependent hydrolase
VTVELRVLSWNVHGLRDDQQALTRIVRDLDPDVMCVQEAPKYLRWRARCAELARRCGLLYVTGAGTTGGTALLASLRVDVKWSAEASLARQCGWPARGVAAAVVAKAGAQVAVASIHLPLTAQRRLEHARRALAVATSADAVDLLVAGDLNEPPGHAAWQAHHDAGLRDLGPHTGPTFPAAAPTRRIDAALGTQRLEVVAYDVVDVAGADRASDHRPVLVTVRATAR